MGLLTALVFLPLAGAVASALVPSRLTQWPRRIALATSLADVVLAVSVLGRFDRFDPGLQLVEQVPWAPGLGISYKLGIDGLSLPLVLLTVGLVVAAVIGSFKQERSPGAFFALLLLLETTMLGVFVAHDLILFYVFWEAVLIPMYFLIGRWGSADRRYAATKFFLYTLAASVLMLAGLITAGLAAGSFDYGQVLAAKTATTLQWALFAAFFVGFAVKVPIVPFHTWLPIAHVEAPTAGSMLLAGVLLKMGTYGMLRFLMPLAPEPFRRAAPWLVALGVVNVLWGAFMALAQKDLKRLVAFSSVSHMGLVVIGIGLATPAAIDGAVFMMVSHGIVSALLFLMVGLVYERTHTRMIAEIGGIGRTMPVLAGVWLFASLASLGLPGLSGFPAEFIVLSEFVSGLKPEVRLAALIPAAAMVITAAYYLWAYQRIGMGEPPEGQTALPEMDLREGLAAAPLMFASLAIGVAPWLVVSLSSATSALLTGLLSRGA
jgi:NADH-quinone oxidoreductase subunit M